MRSLLIVAMLAGVSVWSQVLASEPQLNTRTVGESWYITSADYDTTGMMCHRDCITISVSERKDGGGAIIFYDLAKVPGLLEKMRVERIEDMVGLRLYLSDEQDSVLAPIITVAQECSAMARSGSPIPC